MECCPKSFTKKLLSKKEIAKGCINYMRINGKAVKASRIFLGNEYGLQIKKLSEHFNVSKDRHKNVKFNYDTFFAITKDFTYCFKWESINDKNMPAETKYQYDDFDYTYHQLMIELVLLQVESIKTVTDGDQIKRLYIDGGFSDNDVYIKLVSHYLRDMELRTTDSSLGSALGAAIAISDSKLNSKFLKKNYSLKKHIPIILK